MKTIVTINNDENDCYYLSLMKTIVVRDDYAHENGSIFGKLPNVYNTKICNEIVWIGNDPPPSFGSFPKIDPFS